MELSELAVGAGDGAALGRAAGFFGGAGFPGGTRGLLAGRGAGSLPPGGALLPAPGRRVCAAGGRSLPPFVTGSSDDDGDAVGGVTDGSDWTFGGGDGRWLGTDAGSSLVRCAIDPGRCEGGRGGSMARFGFAPDARFDCSPLAGVLGGKRGAERDAVRGRTPPVSPGASCATGVRLLPLSDGRDGLGADGTSSISASTDCMWGSTDRRFCPIPCRSGGVAGISSTSVPCSVGEWESLCGGIGRPPPVGLGADLGGGDGVVDVAVLVGGAGTARFGGR